MILFHIKLFLDKHNILSKEQFGFLAKHSTVTQLLSTINEWIPSLNCGNCIDVVYIDLSKAFDTVCHSKLIFKLEQYGLQGHLLRWIKEFLRNRTQQIKIKGYLSNPQPCNSGVPQGSVLSPILFNLYINDVVDVLSQAGVCCKLYADDVKLYFPFSPQDGINSALAIFTKSTI